MAKVAFEILVSPMKTVKISVHFLAALYKELAANPTNAPQIFLPKQNIEDMPWPESVLDATDKTVTYFSSLRETSIICTRKDFMKRFPEDMKLHEEDMEQKKEALRLAKEEEYQPKLFLKGEKSIDMPEKDYGLCYEIFNDYKKDHTPLGVRYDSFERIPENVPMEYSLYSFLTKVDAKRKEEYENYKIGNPDWEGNYYDLFGGWIKVHVDKEANQTPDVSDSVFLEGTNWMAYVTIESDSGGHVHVVRKEVYNKLFNTN